VELTLDRATNQIATPTCPDDYTTAFIDGTQPTQTCEQSARGNVFQRIFGIDPKPNSTPPVSNSGTSNGGATPSPGQSPSVQQNSAQSQQDQDKKKKGFWGKIFGGSKDDNKDDNKDIKPAATPSPGRDRPQ
jgi:penicillin-binding protein 1B